MVISVRREVGFSCLGEEGSDLVILLGLIG